MDKQDDYIMPSRAEYIKLARESCSRNHSSNINGKAHNAYKVKEKGLIEDIRTGEARTGEAEGRNFKIFLTRLICASLLFLMVFLMDQFDFSIKQVTVSKIERLVADNIAIEDAQNFFVSFLDKFR